MRKIIIAATVTVLAALTMLGLAMLGLAGTASAAEANSVITRSTTSYSSPSNQSAPGLPLTAGTLVDTVCFTEGQTLNGNHYWFRIQLDGTSSYVHRDAITPPTGLRHC
jgi:hypothetical protein